MTSPVSVNYVFENLKTLEGQPVELEGILSSQMYVMHYPSAEGFSEFVCRGRSYEPGVVLDFGNGSIQANYPTLERWVGKRVRVHGIIRSRLLPPERDGWDVLGLMVPASIEVYSLQRLTADERREHVIPR
jgi:hypothetical protein